MIPNSILKLERVKALKNAVDESIARFHFGLGIVSAAKIICLTTYKLSLQIHEYSFFYDEIMCKRYVKTLSNKNIPNIYSAIKGFKGAFDSQVSLQSKLDATEMLSRAAFNYMKWANYSYGD